MEENKTKAKIIAVAGKGGVGKTSLCSAIVRELVEAFPGKRILAIDADPAVGLSTALGVHVEHTIDDIRNEVIETSERGEYRQAIEVLNEARFRIFDTMVRLPGDWPSGGRRMLLLGQLLPQGSHQYARQRLRLRGHRW